MLPDRKISYSEFLAIDQKSSDPLEYINGQIFLQASPSTEHQLIVTNLSAELRNFFKKTNCQTFVSPYDIILQSNEETNRVQPDLTVICDKQGLTKNNYLGTPDLVVEVLSPSTAAKDYIIKMNLYMRAGVKEYWIVSPRNRTVQVFVLDRDTYGEPLNFTAKDALRSVLFPHLVIDLGDIFE